MWKESNGQLICNLATWISSLCFLEVKSRTITICCTDPSAVRKTFVVCWKSHAFSNLVLKSDFLLFSFCCSCFFFECWFCLVFQAFFLLQRKTDRKKAYWECISTVIISSHFSGHPLGANKKNPRPWDLAFTLWASFSQVSRCLALRCVTMKETILESVVRWWNRQTPSTLHRVWACSRLRCHKWFPRMFFFWFACFVFRNGLEEINKKQQHFLTHLGILRDFWLPSTPTTVMTFHDSTGLQPRWRPALIGIHEPSYRVSKRRP